MTCHPERSEGSRAATATTRGDPSLPLAGAPAPAGSARDDIDASGCPMLASVDVRGRRAWSSPIRRP